MKDSNYVYKGDEKVKSYQIYDMKRKLVIFEEGEQEYWIDSITVKAQKNDRTSNVVRVRAQNVHTNELTAWQEFVGVIDPVHKFLKTLHQ